MSLRILEISLVLMFIDKRISLNPTAPKNTHVLNFSGTNYLFYLFTTNYVEIYFK